MRRAVLLTSLLLCGEAGGAAASERCPDDGVPWKGECFGRHEWRPDEKTCPEGIIEIPEGEDTPRCTPCDGYSGAQQPLNFCAGVFARRAEKKMGEVFEQVLSRFPERDSTLREEQAAWASGRETACRRAERSFAGGSMAAEAYHNCMNARARKRLAELKRMLAPPSKPKSNSAPPDRAPAQEPAQRPPFKDFCANAFAKKTRDKITLRILEAILGVTGCDQLDAAMGSLTKFDPSARYSYEIGSPSSLAALAYAPKLRKVTLWYGCPVVDLSPLENLTELTLLWMGGTKIKDLSPLRRLTKLENVDVRTSKVNDITPLMELPNLKTLTIQNLRVPRTQIDQFKSKHPGADVFF